MASAAKRVGIMPGMPKSMKEAKSPKKTKKGLTTTSVRYTGLVSGTLSLELTPDA